MPLQDSSNLAQVVLYVDDESISRKWFARAFGDEFRIVTAAGVDEALAVLADQRSQVAVLMTDYRMPEQDGMKLLAAVQREHHQVIRLLATAYAGKDVAIAAVNHGRVLRILEKPLDDTLTREALREALALHQSRALKRAVNEGRLTGLRETLGFLAHELNTPLATVRGLVGTLAERYQPPSGTSPAGVAQLTEHTPGEVLAALQSAERRALYCQSLVATFVQSARDAYPGASAQSVSGSGLVDALLSEFPFDGTEGSWVSQHIEEDFELPGRRDLLYLVLCTVTKNALLALRGRAAPRLHITVCRIPAGPGAGSPCIRFDDNGPGIPPDVLPRLLREPVTTRAASGGNGMGLMFCQRVMHSIGGEIAVDSEPGRGASVCLLFKSAKPR